MILRYLYGQDELVAHFVAQMTSHVRERGFGKCRAIGIVNADSELIGGLVYHNFDDGAGVIEISGAALPGHLWLTRETLRQMHGYPFEQCRCQMVVMRVLASNERLLRQLAALGYAFIRFPRLFGRDRDGVICSLTDDAWRDSRIARRLSSQNIGIAKAA